MLFHKRAWAVVSVLAGLGAAASVATGGCGGNVDGVGASSTGGAGASGPVGAGASGPVGAGASGPVGVGASSSVGAGPSSTVGAGPSSTVGVGGAGPMTTGNGGDGTGGNGGYGQNAHRAPESHHAVALADGASISMALRWHDAPGLAPPADLWVEAGGRTLLQVSSMGMGEGAHPFVRAGLDVAPIEPGDDYRLVLKREGDAVAVTLVHGADGKVVLRGEGLPVPSSGDDAIVADVVLPAASWRATVVLDLP
jgi:hypothetical protein